MSHAGILPRLAKTGRRCDAVYRLRAHDGVGEERLNRRQDNDDLVAAILFVRVISVIDFMVGDGQQGQSKLSCANDRPIFCDKFSTTSSISLRHNRSSHSPLCSRRWSGQSAECRVLDRCLLVCRPPADHSLRVPAAQQAPGTSPEENQRSHICPKNLNHVEFFRGWRRKMGCVKWVIATEARANGSHVKCDGTISAAGSKREETGSDHAVPPKAAYLPRMIYNTRTDRTSVIC
jgi:hypothetical protein